MDFIKGLLIGVVLATACMVIQAYAERKDELKFSNNFDEFKSSHAFDQFK